MNLFAEHLHIVITPDCAQHHINFIEDLMAKARLSEHAANQFSAIEVFQYIRKTPYIKFRTFIKLLEK